MMFDDRSVIEQVNGSGILSRWRSGSDSQSWFEKEKDNEMLDTYYIDLSSNGWCQATTQSTDENCRCCKPMASFCDASPSVGVTRSDCVTPVGPIWLFKYELSLLSFKALTRYAAYSELVQLCDQIRPTPL